MPRSHTLTRRIIARLTQAAYPSRAIAAFFIFACVPLGLSARESGADFIREADYLFRVIACGPGDLPTGIDPSLISDHCRRMEGYASRYRKKFIDPASEFFAKELPPRLPKKVLVPFGGGDLLPAMTVYPDATEYVTISLEHAGDPRRARGLSTKQLSAALAGYRRAVGFLLTQYDLSNEAVRDLERGPLPNQIMFSLTALAITGCRPLSLRFFSIEADGTVHYLDEREIGALEKTKPQRLKATWRNADCPEAFMNMEIRFKKKDGRTAVHRHIAFNLANARFVGSGLERLIRSGGDFAAMVKGGSYLLWYDSFSGIRNALLERAVCIVSDATGILPRHAAAAGFVQEPYGRFTAAFLPADGGGNAAELRALFDSRPFRPLPFMFGYSDTRRTPHIIISLKRKAFPSRYHSMPADKPTPKPLMK